MLQRRFGPARTSSGHVTVFESVTGLAHGVERRLIPGEHVVQEVPRT